MKRNGDSNFVGIEALKDRQAQSLTAFREWAAGTRWHMLHRAHYDWWMFPIDEPSGYGLAYTVYEGDVAELKGDAAYLARYAEGAEILATAWGWDLAGARPIDNPGPGQCWQDWPIRLYKATKSLKLFGLEDRFESFRAYGRGLLARGVSFDYTRDLTWLFR